MTASGKLVYMNEPGSLELREYDVPAARPGELVALVRRANVCGSEVHIFKGQHPLLKKSALGHEMVGEVFDLGEGLTTDFMGRPVQPGDRIAPVYYYTCRRCAPCSRGELFACQHAYDWWMTSPDDWPHFHATFGTHYYMHQGQAFFRVPDSVSDNVASIANCALAQVMFGLDKAAIRLGETVVIQGAGGLGLSAAAYAKELGARVVVIDGIPDRLELARKFGADEVVDMAELADVPARAARILELTDGVGADVVVEVAGHPAAFAESIGLARMGGRVVEAGNISPGNLTPFDPGLLTRRCLTVHAVNRYDPIYLDHALQFLAGGGARYPFDTLIGEALPLEESAAAIAQAERREGGRSGVTGYGGA